MTQSRTTTVCVLLEGEPSECVHIQLVFSIFSDIWLISQQYSHFPMPSDSSPHLFYRMKWSLANICLLIKKNGRSLACNYHPVS